MYTSSLIRIFTYPHTQMRICTYMHILHIRVHTPLASGIMHASRHRLLFICGGEGDEDLVDAMDKATTTRFPAPAEPKAKAKSMLPGNLGGKGYGSKTIATKVRVPIDHNAPASSSSAGENPATVETMKLLMDTMTAMKEEIKQLRENQSPEEPRCKKKEETETEATEATERSFTMVLDP